MVAVLLLAAVSGALGQTSNLTYDATFDAELWGPGRLAPAPGGGVYVTDPAFGVVRQYASDGALAGSHAVPQLPVGIAVHPDGRIFISRRDGAIGIYDAAFTALGVLNPAPAVLVQPNDLAIHPVTGEVYVADSAANQILVFDGTTGTLVRMWGLKGSDLSNFESPQAIAIDPVRDHVIVADADNFRVQVFDTAGMLQFKFGYRILYLPTSQVAWFPRSEGLAVDGCGNIYVADALMGTIRSFSPLGKELSATFQPLASFGTGLGQLRVPCDLLIEGGRLFAASSNNSAIEVYTVSCSPAQAPAGPLFAQDSDEGTGQPLDGSGEAGASPAVSKMAGPYAFPLQPPHLPNYPYTCSRCHDADGAPAGGMLTSAGQENLCLSCHTSTGHALHTAIAGGDKTVSHPWGVPASNSNVPGPAPQSELALHLDNGNIRCGTCHNPHESPAGDDAKYLRRSVRDAALCGECHAEAAQWQLAGHADEHADPWSHYDWSQPSRAACRQCHSGNGYIDYSEGVASANQRGDFRVADCLVCHSAHGKPQDEQLLRIFGSAKVASTGQIIANKGASATCISCHNGRSAPPATQNTTTSVSTPHYLLAGVMMEGINAVTFGHTLQNSPHTAVASCVDCHMAPTPAPGQPGAGKVGGHTFKMKVTDATDPDYGFENAVNACQSCHPGLTTLNRTAFADYDGNGATEGVQDEVAGLMALVLGQLQARGAVQLAGYPYWDLNGVPSADRPLVKNAVWNWEYVDNSADLGIHNTAFAVGLLQVTYKQLAGADVPGGFLRYSTPIASLSGTHVAITQVNGGVPVQPGSAFSVNFAVTDDNGATIPRASLDRLQVGVSGPASNYQRVIVQEGNNIVQNPDGSFTYTRAAFPTVYAAPLNDSPALTQGELTGQPLLDGTYTVWIEARRSFGSIRKAGDATADFVVDGDGASPPAVAHREVVKRETCNNCHNDLRLHGNNRYAVTACVLCHTAGSEDRVTNPASTPGLTIEFHDMIHRLHRSSSLPRLAATANSADPYRYVIRGFGGAELDFSHIGFPVLPNGVMKCAACHEGAAQSGRIYTTITRARCSTCHDDIDFTTGTILDTSNPSVSGGLLTQADLSNPAYRVAPGGITHAFIDDTACTACHGIGAPWDVQDAHQFITDPEKEGLQPAIEIVSVTGMTGGGGTYFQAGDRPRVRFKLRNNAADPLQLITNNKSVADSLSFIVAGPTALYQTIIPAVTPWSSGKLSASVPAADWIDNFAVDGTYTYVMAALPATFPAQIYSIGQAPASQIYPFEGGWGQQYTAAGTPLGAGSYTVIAYGRRLASDNATREPITTGTYDFAFGAAGPIEPYAGTVETASCNACHNNMAFHGNQREGVRSCLGCHTAGAQNRNTGQSIDLRIMIHKLHNARNLTVQPYELNTFAGIHDFSDLLISSMPGAAAECHECHTTNAWKSPPARDNMRTWMVACTSCHDSAEVAAHVDGATLPGTFVETCVSCHGEGAAWSVERMHKSD